ncbi:Transcriptional regulator [Frankia canadensis]|uniref:Transcriptional regulator n=1 Tax=Frankia canadensis TaxID=1836972 RepID=A0A2I2L0T7_9ACTN|nr:TetR family transcriptional regulator [Frankia canadensis]SNQ51543.1 Transcriptional regulator [Frankia canadensis]SOU58833.1 Transcriptional regulator [Frankia canadensis]
MPATASAGRPRSRRARGSISADGILSGAFEFCRSMPGEQLSMPRLAAFLDVGVTSIYWYYKSKQELLDAMAERALGTFYRSVAPLRGDRWEDVLSGFFVDVYSRLAADVVTREFVLGRIGGPAFRQEAARWPRATELLERLGRAGFPTGMAWHAFQTLVNFARGSLLAERAGDTDPASEFTVGVNAIVLGFRHLLAAELREHAAA